MGDKRKRHRAWVSYARKQDIRFYWFWFLVGSVARFFYRLSHWDWKDHTPPPEPPLAEIVAKFDGPVYGLLDDFLELTPDGRSYGSNEIGLNYQVGWLRDEEAKPGVCIETAKTTELDGPWPWLGLQVRMAAFGAAWSFNSQSFRERGMDTGSDPYELMDRFPWEAIPNVPLHIPGFRSDTIVWRWSVPEPVHVAVLRNDSVKLTLSTFGLTIEQLQELTTHIGPLNERPELLVKYREQADARVNEYVARLQGGSA
jgi:hypothetical protein